MKSMALCVVLLCVLVSLSAAEEKVVSTANADDAIVQLWNAHSEGANPNAVQSGKLTVSSENELNNCLYLRVYQMKRQGKKSDVTIPSGYTTCVPMNGLNVFKTGVYTPKASPK